MRLRYIYTFLLYLLTPCLILRLFWKGCRLPSYRKRILERFALQYTGLSSVDVWIHAVSLGEVIAAIPLMELCLAHSWRVLVTTMTPTGSAQVLKQFGSRVSHCYLPYDLPAALKRFFNKSNPRIGIIMETELWPNMIYEASQRHLPLFLVNARLSDKAFPQYQTFRWFFKPLLKRITAILAQSTLDAERFMALGVPFTQITVAGNMKFDLQPPRARPELVFNIAWGVTRPVFIAASTHEGEESQLLLHLKSLQHAIPHALLLIAPRHPERFQAVYDYCIAQGFSTGCRSNLPSINPTIEVLIIDSLGELISFYSQSDYAFVGGSFVPVGGHNVLEPMAVGVPVFCGPFMQNSKAICEELLAAKAMVMVPDAATLIAAWITMYHDSEMRTQQVQHAANVLVKNQGAVQRCFEKIKAILAK